VPQVAQDHAPDLFLDLGEQRWTTAYGQGLQHDACQLRMHIAEIGAAGLKKFPGLSTFIPVIIDRLGNPFFHVLLRIGLGPATRRGSVPASVYCLCN